MEKADQKIWTCVALQVMQQVHPAPQLILSDLQVPLPVFLFPYLHLWEMLHLRLTMPILRLHRIYLYVLHHWHHHISDLFWTSTCQNTQVRRSRSISLATSWCNSCLLKFDLQTPSVLFRSSSRTCIDRRPGRFYGSGNPGSSANTSYGIIFKQYWPNTETPPVKLERDQLLVLDWQISPTPVMVLLRTADPTTCSLQPTSGVIKVLVSFFSVFLWRCHDSISSFNGFSLSCLLRLSYVIIDFTFFFSFLLAN